MKKLLLPLLIIIVLSSSCSKWGWVTLQYPNPPQLTLSDNIKTIAIVNRSLVKQDDKNKNILETVASAEVAGSDKLASDECIKAVFDRMNGWSDISI
ncbi:MAG TPA: hypothetical protein PKY63_07345, partial [Bacteroidales bacterium]|nr:hypothetical protein [Bacteroidales bacterium]